MHATKISEAANRQPAPDHGEVVRLAFAADHRGAQGDGFGSCRIKIRLCLLAVARLKSQTHHSNNKIVSWTFV